ncbi:GDSL-like lipase/acylhydrolase family protein [Nitzschia inconspicua]|uniref:GDSL-like lipase/acylhydrolase family protein n=1 Tax=Nitzschia inconspicua TaxID=303405 RepID=A0A9K3L6A4_9STRA|nr:GDSL-like lipase/acylhydrolase family protein [Nitzschia inconspicua]
MAMVNSKPLKKPLGRTLKERLFQEQQMKNRYRSSSPRAYCSNRRIGSCLKLLLLLAIFPGMLYFFGNQQTKTPIPDKEAVIIPKTQEERNNSGMLRDNNKKDVTPHQAVVPDVQGENVKSKSSTIRVVPLATLHERPIRIFCYGDSLTAGVAPPAQDQFPYAETLQQSLIDKAKSRGKNTLSFEVEHAGFPGWTAKKLQDQLKSPDRNEVQTKLMQRDTLDPNSSYYDILIFFAGTNDLGHENESEQSIVTNILNVHAWAHHVARIPFTIAMPIPGSAFQSRNSAAANRAATINKGLQSEIRKNFPHFSTSSASTLWTPFPISYGAEKEDWALDGLHLSQHGYQQLGEYLASIIHERLIV